MLYAKLRSLLDLGTGPELSAGQKRSVRTTNLVAMVAAAAIGSWAIISFGSGQVLNAAQNFGAFLGYALVLWVNHKARYNAAAALLLRLSSAVAMVLLAASAAGLYYWYAAATITTAFELPSAGSLAIRIAALALVAFWLAKALPRAVNSSAGAAAH